MSVADYVRELLRNSVEREIAEREKREMIHQRLANLEEASPEESAEILAYLESMTDEDREIVAESVIYVRRRKHGDNL